MVTHGVAGWELVEYEWDEKTGLGYFLYEKWNAEAGQFETHELIRAQPATREHRRRLLA